MMSWSQAIQIFVFLWKAQTSTFVTLLHNQSYAYFVWILSSIKMKFGQILVRSITRTSNMFLAQSWRLEISFEPFYDFIKMKI